MSEQTIYIKINPSSQVTHEKILLEDVAEILCSDSRLQKEARQQILCLVPRGENQKLIYSSMKVVELLEGLRPGLQVEHMGPTEFVVTYRLEKKPVRLWEWIKTFLMFGVVFCGGAFTIMTFNTDVSVGDVFSMFYKLIMGHEEKSGTILEISYSLGIATGVLGFYNHFTWRKLRDDPTPIHMEMRKYEQDMDQAVIVDAARKGEMRK